MPIRSARHVLPQPAADLLESHRSTQDGEPTQRPGGLFLPRGCCRKRQVNRPVRAAAGLYRRATRQQKRPVWSARQSLGSSVAERLGAERPAPALPIAPTAAMPGRSSGLFGDRFTTPLSGVPSAMAWVPRWKRSALPRTHSPRRSRPRCGDSRDPPPAHREAHDRARRPPVALHSLCSCIPRTALPSSFVFFITESSRGNLIFISRRPMP